MKDLILDEDDDLVIKGNDLYVGTSDEQHKMLLLVTEKGAIKQYPATGVGVATYMESEDVAGLLSEIALQWTADGMIVKKISIVDSQLLHDAHYK